MFSTDNSLEFPRSYSMIDTILNFCICAYSYGVISMLKNNNSPHPFIARVPLSGASAVAGVVFLAREYKNRYNFK
jgi:hypothetical protein